MKYLMIILVMSACGCFDCGNQSIKAEKVKSEYEMTLTRDLTDDAPFTTRRLENREVVCYRTSEGGLWCYKKEQADGF